MIPITEKLLSGAGGWQAMKAARELVKAGRVVAASYEPPLLAGEVREGGKTYRSGLRIRTALDLENICTCRESRQWGKVCAHSLAVGLSWLAPAPVALPPVVPNDAPESSPRRFGPLDETGRRPVALHFILPPNFRAAWGKPQLMVCIEAELAGRRIPLGALSPAEHFGCEEADLAALESLGAEIGGVNMLTPAAFLRWLPAMRGNPRLSFGKALPASVAPEIWRPVFAVKAALAGFEISANLEPEESPLVAGDEAWLLRKDVFLELGHRLPPRLTSVLAAPLRLETARADEFFAFELPLWRETVEVELPAGISLPVVEAAEPIFSLQVEGSLQHLRVALRCRYGDRPALAPMAEPEKPLAFRDPARPNCLLVRNLPKEQEAIARLERAGFDAAGTGFDMRDSGRIVRFFAFDFPALPVAWKVSITPRLEQATNELEPVTPTIEIVRSGEDWFELKYSVATAEGEGIPAAEVQRLLRSGQSQARLTNGRIAVLNPDTLDDFEQVLRDADPRQNQPGVYRLKNIQAAYLTNTAEEIGARVIGAAQLFHQELSIAGLGPLAQQLRDYQRTGVQWLAALAARNLGGILADEMGLGKTVQTLAFLRLPRGPGPALIVCPTSLLSNWQREVARFTPELKVLRIDGPDRAQKIARLAGHDIGLTSYGLLRRDSDLYAGLTLSTVVLDEAQHIKNPDTQNAQAAFSLRAGQRFVLTGTPMENSVRDLWSLMNFVAPGYLGSRKDFRDRYEKPLAEGHAAARPVSARLARRLRPFLLRRRKADVARELPEKIEQVVPCDLGPAQRATYHALLREIQQGLGAAGASDGATRMKMLSGLLRLRQTCCDLRLLGSPPNEAAEPSAKLDLLDELLEEIIDGGHRVLIFSQFVKMLDLIKERLAARETTFCYLAGLTKNRQAEVDRFQNDETIPVFLISLKAGGVGLNLSAADTVIHFDPWWNAAVEAQATDRAHRIGQTRVVTSYKLIARDTVEEKILNLQKRKRELASAMLENEEPLMTGLTSDDLADLLATDGT
ncbi:MAG: SNF2-related protein [Spartobacteria bacterium]